MAEHGGVDVSIAPNSSVTLEPADSLAFHLAPQTAPQAVLTIRNVSDERKIAFKVKTTRPLRYLVRPNQGLLAPNGSASVMVILQQKDGDELLRLDPSERQLSNDKFLVQSLFVDDAFYELVKTKSAKEMADELTNMWAHTDKKALSNKKLRCRFLQQDEASADSPAVAAPTASAPPEPSPAMLRYQNRQASQFSSASDLAIHASESSSADAEVTTAAQLSSALLQESASPDKPANHKASDGSTTKVTEGRGWALLLTRRLMLWRVPRSSRTRLPMWLLCARSTTRSVRGGVYRPRVRTGRTDCGGCVTVAGGVHCPADGAARRAHERSGQNISFLNSLLL